MRSRGLSPKQRAFVDAYNGDAREAAIAAGYSRETAYTAGPRLMKHPAVQEALRERTRIFHTEIARRAEASGGVGHIMSRLERQALWTRVALGHELERHVTEDGQVLMVAPALKDRLKASELLGKSEGDFVENVQVNGRITLEALVLAAAKVKLEP